MRDNNAREANIPSIAVSIGFAVLVLCAIAIHWAFGILAVALLVFGVRRIYIPPED